MKGDIMRIVGIAIFSAIVATANAAGTTTQPIDLNQPGALEKLRTERPKHFSAISEVLRVVERVPCGNAEVRSLEARFDIRDMACNFLLMTSDPPKRHLSFELEGTSYVAVVTLKDTGGKSVPVK
jgi:hypothetical protein